MAQVYKISKITKIAIIVGLIIIVIWAGSGWLLCYFFNTPQEPGTFGDMFGAINALFSGLAFAGLIITLLYQKEELQLQREELQQTRKEMSKQREEFEAQNKTLQCQRFENTFFNMLSLQQELVSNICYYYNNNEHRGRDVFEKLYKNAPISYDGSSRPGIVSLLREKGYEAYTKISIVTRLNHYFRHLYCIYNYVDSSVLISDEERYEYVDIVNSQLSDYELLMLFYHCITNSEQNQFKIFIEKYAVFRNLKTKLLASPDDDMLLYDDSAYKLQ